MLRKSNISKNLFMENEPNFQKVKSNVTQAITKTYAQMDTWSRRTKRTQTNPIFSSPKQPILPSFTPANYEQ